VNSAFYFYFPSEHRAEKAAEVLTQEGFRVDVEPLQRPIAGDNWVAVAQCDMTEEEYFASDDRMEALAKLLGGVYDGRERALLSAPHSPKS
jgi:hypothetical protein